MLGSSGDGWCGAGRPAGLLAETGYNMQILLLMQETWVQSLCWEDTLEEDMATSPAFLPRKSHGQRSLVGYSPWGCKEVDTAQ